MDAETMPGERRRNEHAFEDATTNPLVHFQYRRDGYVVLRGCIPSGAMDRLRSLVSVCDLRRRKPDLLGQAELVSAVDGLVRTLFLVVGVDVARLVELSALVATPGQSVKLGWHKDRPTPDGGHAFQLPLLPGDRFHELVPGSQAREWTEAERTARDAGGGAMPGAVSIGLDVGDVLLRSPFVLHRGYNPQGVERLTLVGTYA